MESFVFDMDDEQSTAEELAVMLQAAQSADRPPGPADELAGNDFPVTLRGYDRAAVDAYVRRVVAVVAELEATRSPESAVRRALERVGDEVGDILKRAHATAAEVTSKSTAEAEAKLSGARTTARETLGSAQGDAESTLADARAEAEQTLAEARAEAARLVRDAQAEADRRRGVAQRRVDEIEAEGQRRIKELDADADRVWAERGRIVQEVRDLAGRLETLADSASDDPVTDGWESSEVTEETAEIDEEGETIVMAAVPDLLSESPTIVVHDHRVEVIDLLHLGRPRVIACFKVGDVLVDPGPSSCLDSLLEALGDWVPRALLLTHIHLDHAGATGSLVGRWPDVEVYVHERGAPHMADPGRLIDSATRLYGEDMDRLWGAFEPVPPERMHLLAGGETILDGAFTVAHTPGHASHHVSYLHAGTAFVGDVGGVRIVPGGPAIPPTPPPDIDLEAWQRSLELVEGWQPDRLAITHFGLVDDVERQLAEVSARLESWGVAARELGEEGFTAFVERELAGGTDDPGVVAAYTQAAPHGQLYAGLERYWRQRHS